MLDDTIHLNTDYFTIPTHTHHYAYTHFTAETPCASPALYPDEDASPYQEHPLLAYRELPLSAFDPSAPIMSSSLMSAQTSAAYRSPQRPGPQPRQNVLHVTCDDSTSSDSSSSSRDSSLSIPEFARCSRCQRTSSIDLKTGKCNMVAYGLNLWYCSRCASLVGLTKR